MTDNELLEQLFGPARQMQVADDGFTERVMRRLPDTSARRQGRLWAGFCVAMAAVVFVLMRGWESIAYGLLMTVNAPPSPETILTVCVAVGVVGLNFLAEVFRQERYSLT